MKKLSLLLSCLLFSACAAAPASENNKQAAKAVLASELPGTKQIEQAPCSRSNYRTVKKREACRAKIRREVLIKSTINEGK